MNYRLLIAASFAVLSSIAISEKAQAQNADIDFNGFVGSACSISSVTNGSTKIATTPGDSSILSSDPNEAAGALPGTFILNCSTSADVSISPPTPLYSSGGDAYSANYSSELRDGETVLARANKNGSAGTAVVTGPINNRTYNVIQRVNNGGVTLPAGRYDYRVSIDVTPR